MIWEVDEKSRVIDGVDAAGRPDPAYAAALGLERAPLGPRALAFTCDLAIWIVLQLPLWLGAMPLVLKLASGSISPYGFVNHPGFVPAVAMAAISVALMLVYAIVQWILHGRRGVTVGKAVTGIRTVNVRTLERPGVWAVLLRFVIVGASGIVPLFGPTIMLLSPTFDTEKRGRGWHDRAAKVWLVDVRAGLNPYDEKRMRIARKTVKADPLPERTELPSLATSAQSAASTEYRPGSRISAGVLGVSRAQEGPGAAIPAVPSALIAPPAPPVPAPPVAAPPVAAAPVPASPMTAPPVTAPPASAAPTPAHRPPASVTVLGLRFDTGESVSVSGPVLIGRDPVSPAHPDARPIRVADTTRSLSKTHALVRPTAGGLEVVDLHSTNGSRLVRGGIERPLTPGVGEVAIDGDLILFGDRVADVLPT